MAYGDGVQSILAAFLAAVTASALLVVAPAQAAAGQVAGFEAQVLDWQRCGASECARLTVPLDYGYPAAGTVTLAVLRVRHTSAEGTGSLVVNPGGPGAAGTDFAEYVATDIAPEVARDYDIVGFDPRGTGDSAPISCLTGRQTSAWLDIDPAPRTLAEQRRLMAVAARTAPGCLERSPRLARHVGTEETVRDMDLLRSALGSERLDFLGFSYGTVLGSRYAELFPDRVGRFVLDGAVDPSLDAMQLSAGQSAGFQRAMRAFARDCARRATCRVGRTGTQVLASVNALLRRLDSRPMATDTGRPLLVAQAVTALFTSMYDTSSWPSLSRALHEAQRGDGTGLQELADWGSDRTGPHSYSTNMVSAFTAISCWDSPPTPGREGLAAAARRWSAGVDVPVMAQAMSWGNAPCSTWFGHSARAPQAARSSTTVPIIVVGTTGDPATPYAWAQALVRQLPTARLVTFVGNGHTAYGNPSPCLQSAISGFLLDGTLPPDGLRCR